MADQSRKKPTLPHGWIERISKTFPDRVYYFNCATGASTWEVPFKQDKVTPKRKSNYSPGKRKGITSSTPRLVPPTSKRLTPPKSFSAAPANEPQFSPVRVDDDPGPTEPDHKTFGSPPGGCGAPGNIGSPVDMPPSSINLGEPSSKCLRRTKRSYSSADCSVTQIGHGLSPKRRVQVKVPPEYDTPPVVRLMVQDSQSSLVSPVESTSVHRRPIQNPSSSCGATSQQSATNHRRVTRRGDSSARRTRSVEIPREVTRKYRQGKGVPGGPKAVLGGRNAQVEDRGQFTRRERERINDNNNNNGKEKKWEGKRLVMSFDEVLTREEEGALVAGKPVRIPVADCRTRKLSTGGAGPSTSKQESSSSSQTKKSPIRPPCAAKQEGVLTVFSSNKKAEQDSGPADLGHQEQRKRLNVIVDTNILLSHLSFVEELRDQYIQGFGRPTLIIPWIVLQELDSLKEGKPYDLIDVRIKYKGSLAKLARSAVNFINCCLINKHPRVLGQSIQESSKKDSGVYTRNNDDKILQCCLQYKNRGKADNTENILLTDDMSLRNKSIVSGVGAFSKESLTKNLADLAKKLQESPAKSPRTTSRVPNGKSPVTKRGSPKKRASSSFTEPAVLTDTAVTKLVDDTVCNLKDVLRAPLSSVLEIEMMAAYDDLWLDIILRKPPWTFLDILDCINKHWIAVFGQICKRPAKFNFEALRVFYRVNNGLGATLATIAELVADAVQFLSHLQDHSSYDGALDTALNHLTKMAEQLNSARESSPRGTMQSSVTASRHSIGAAQKRTNAKQSKTSPVDLSRCNNTTPRAKALPHRTASGSSTKKTGSLRSLKDVVKESSARAAVELSERKTNRERQQAAVLAHGSKRIRINRASLQPKIKVPPRPPSEVLEHRKALSESLKTQAEVLSESPETQREVGPEPQEAPPGFVSVTAIDDEDIAMDTASEPEFVSVTTAPGASDEVIPSGSNYGRTVVRHRRYQGDRSVHSGHHNLPPEQHGVSSNQGKKITTPHKPETRSPINHLFPPTPTSPDTPSTMWEQLSGTPLQSLSGSGMCSSTPSSQNSGSTMGTSGAAIGSTNQGPLVLPPSVDNEMVQQVLERAYQEMRTSCTRVEQSVQVHQSGLMSNDHLTLKESCTLIEYLVQYLEKSIVAMEQVLSVTESNGVMAATGDQIFQGLIDVIDSFFSAMEVSSSGSGLTPGMLNGYLRVGENRESLKMGTFQYQAALQGCQLCYQFMVQLMT